MKGYVVSVLDCISICIFDTTWVGTPKEHLLFFSKSSFSNLIRLFIVGSISKECGIVYATHNSTNFSSSML